MNRYFEDPGGSEQFQYDCTGENFVHKAAVSKINQKQWSKKAILTTFMSCGILDPQNPSFFFPS